jgi:hypothetical protein
MFFQLNIVITFSLMPHLLCCSCLVLAVISYANDPKNVIELQKPSENGPFVYAVLQ